MESLIVHPTKKRAGLPLATRELKAMDPSPNVVTKGRCWGSTCQEVRNVVSRVRFRANPVNKVIQILTSDEAKVKAELCGCSQSSRRVHRLVQHAVERSDGESGSARRDSLELRHRHSEKCDRHNREGDERWSFDDECYRCTRCDGTQTVTSSRLASNASVTRSVVPAKLPSSGFHVTSFQSNMECDGTSASICTSFCSSGTKMVPADGVSSIGDIHHPLCRRQNTSAARRSTSPQTVTSSLLTPSVSVCGSVIPPYVSVARRSFCQASGGRRWVGGEPNETAGPTR